MRALPPAFVSLAITLAAGLACTSTGQVLGPGGSVVLRTSDARLASGWNHSCVVSGGVLACWGDDGDGRDRKSVV